MNEQLILLDTFKLAKERGFNIYICRCGGFPECICNHDELLPTQSLLQKWLREIHEIEVSVKVFYSPQLNREGSFKYWGMYTTKNCVGDCDKATECKDKYENAFEEALVLALNKITV